VASSAPIFSVDDLIGTASGTVAPEVAAAVASVPIPRAPQRASTRPATAGTPDAVVPAAPAVDPAVELAQVRARATEIKKENFFQVLGIPESTDALAVKMAYFKLAKIYHPDTVSPDAPAEMGKLKAEIFSVVGEAYRRLQDDKSRAEYLADLKAGGATDLDIGKILHAEELFQKGTILVKARKYPDAVKMLDEAIGANPDEAEFHAWRGYARFFAAPDKKTVAAEVQKEIQQALARNPRCAPAHYFLGHIAKLMGDTPAALKHFKKTVELDPHHIDAQRELRGPPKR
jgi:curved DNA-binding protein CbpA